jgi:hypothetical protein
MLRGAPARSDRDAGGSRERSILELLSCIRGGVRIAVAACLLACLGQGLWAQAEPQKLTVHRSTRAIPHKFVVHPSEATVPVNQTQQFEVTDAQGNPVAVHWNVSGIGCSGLGCGTIDDHGVYRTPASLPKPRVVTVEGVLVSDPNYSVLTQVWLENPVTASATPAKVSTEKTQPLTAPEVGREKLAVSAGLPPLPNVVAAAPSVGRQMAHSAGSAPLPNVVAPAPTVGVQNLASNSGLPPLADVLAAAPTVRKPHASSVGSPPLPNVVAPAPAVGRQNLASNTGLVPLPNVIASAPAVETQKLARSAELPPPSVIAAAPAVGTQKLTRSAELPPPSVIASAPAVQKQKLARRDERSIELSTPNVIAAAPLVQKQKLAPSAELPAPSPVAAAPVVGKQNLAGRAESPALPTIVAAVSPTSPPVPAAKATQLVVPAAGRQGVAASAVLAPMMPDVVAAVPPGTADSAQHGPVVTYRDGQLTIDAEGSTLAAVLQLIAEKTGAVIEIPPGSGSERIVEHTGPAPANDVLERLLNGSPFNFIIVSSPQHPSQPAQVLLSLHGPDTPMVASVQPNPPSNPFLTPPPEPAPDAAAVPYAIDPRNFQLPKEPLTPEAIGELMKEKGRELREALQKQQ